MCFTELGVTREDTLTLQDNKTTQVAKGNNPGVHNFRKSGMGKHDCMK